jgi:hypothetical protein
MGWGGGGRRRKKTMPRLISERVRLVKLILSLIPQES